MAGGGGGDSLSLEETPTWAVAAVCTFFVVISVILEESIHHVGKWLLKHRKKYLYEALEKIKSELMLLGFISLLLTVGQEPISKICISRSLSETMLPCKKKAVIEDADTSGSSDEKHRKLLWEIMYSSHKAPSRILAAAASAGEGYCSNKVIRTPKT